MKTSTHTSTVITVRDIALFGKLSAAGWLTTQQIQEYFFPGKSTNAVCKRLRKLATDGYVAMVRTSSTEQALYRLAGQGKLALIEHASYAEEDISIPTQAPRKLEHFVAVNDLRLRFEQMSVASGVELRFFFSERELARYYEHSHLISESALALLVAYKIIPDALAKVRITCGKETREVFLAIEYDAGTEQPAFFGKTKVKKYSALFKENPECLGDFKVLTFASSVKRLLSLMRHTIPYDPPRYLFYFASPKKLEDEQWVASDIFLDPWDFFVPVQQASHITVSERNISSGSLPQHALIALPTTSPRGVSSREESSEQISYGYGMS